MRLLGLVTGAALACGPALAAESDPALALWQALRMDEVISIMVEEGRAYGADLDRDLLGGTGGAGFSAQVAMIYDHTRMRDAALGGFAEALEATDVTPMTDFFTSDLGARIVSLELSARQALLDPDVEAASREAVQAMTAGGDPRLAQLSEFVAVNDLVESNLMGALNASFAFYQGMSRAGAASDAPGEQDMLADVWSQEDALRTETEDWVYGFIAMAYQPLGDDELAAYTDFSRSDAGQQMNRAIFAAFDQMFVDISRELGASVGRYLAGEAL